jgi:archaellum component FlaC
MAEETILDTPDVEEPNEGNSLTADVDVPTFDDDPEEPGDKEKTKDKPKDSDKDSDKDTPDDELKSRFEKLEKNYNRASSHIEDLNKAISGLRKENKDLKKSVNKPDKDGDFTDAQLVQIIDENKDDPGVLVHAVKQLIKQNNADLKELTDKKVDIARKRTEIDGVMKGWQAYIDKNQDSVDKAIDYHGLDDHPFKEHLALGAIMVTAWPKMVESIKEEAKKEALSGVSEEARKKNIKNNKPDTSGDRTNTGDGETPSSWAEAAERLGLNKKQRERYFNLMKKSSKKKES